MQTCIHYKIKIKKMKSITILVFAICLIFKPTLIKAQKATSFEEGTITLANGTIKKGNIINNLAKKGTIQFKESKESKKQILDGTQLNALIIGNTNYQCINGDFFKEICLGKICFLQKASKTSTKVIYSGTTPVAIAGTNGKLNDYFLYNNKNLQLLTKKNVSTILKATLINCASLNINKVNIDDLSSVAEIITSYNKCN